MSQTSLLTKASLAIAAAVMVAMASWPAAAQDIDPEQAVARCDEMVQTAPRGNSGQPLPRFVSVRYTKANVRRGPDKSHAIDWQYVRHGLPLMVVAEHKDWRKVCDVEGSTGWVHLTQLSGKRTVLVLVDGVSMRMRSEVTARRVAVVRRNAVLEMRQCSGQWCLVRYDALTGWMHRSSIWGTMARDAG